MSHISPQQRLIFNELISTEAAAPRTPPFICTLVHSWTKALLEQSKENSLTITLKKPWAGINDLSMKFFISTGFVGYYVLGFFGGGLLGVFFVVVGWFIFSFFVLFNLKKQWMHHHCYGAWAASTAAENFTKIEIYWLNMTEWNGLHHRGIKAPLNLSSVRELEQETSILRNCRRNFISKSLQLQ